MTLRVLFMGTPSFAAIVLQHLLEAGVQPVLVVTVPDRHSGRGRKVTRSAVKELAESRGLPLFQPEDTNTKENVKRMADSRPDVIALAAYGQILAPEVLTLPPLGPLNVHPSLLPDYRGPAPIQWALLDGKDETGVTIFKMNPRIDRGEILLQKTVPILPGDDFPSLHDKLAVEGAGLLIAVLRRLEAGEVIPPHRQEGKGSYRKKFKKKNGRIKWEQSAVKCHNRVRALNPWPGTFTFLNGRRLRIWKTKVAKGPVPDNPAAGQVIEASGERGIRVVCSDGVLVLKEIQIEGKKRLSAADFLRGSPLAIGDILG